MRKIIVIILVLFLADAAFAQSAVRTNCDGSTTQTRDRRQVGDGEIICCEAEPTATGSCDVEIVAEKASICLNRDTGSTGGAAAIAVKWCTPGSTPGANTCTTINSITTDDCEAYSRGLYQIEYTTGPAAGENARTSVRAY